MLRKMILALVALTPVIAINGCQETDERANGISEKTLVDYMDEYHRVLRPLMHQALPDKDVAAFKENAGKLVDYAEKLATAEIPSEFADSTARIDSLVRELLVKTRVFRQTCEVGTDQEIFDTFMTAHDVYEALADIVYALK